MVKPNLLAALLLSFLVLIVRSKEAVCLEQGLVARYTFDEGSGLVAEDSSGNGNDVHIHGARYIRMPKGYALEFDGAESYGECLNRPSLDLKDSATLEVWINPYGLPVGEPGIVGKGDFFNEYLGLTYYENGGCYFYISTGGNNCSTKLEAGSWHHVAGTFDGKKMSLYVGGRLVSSRASKMPKINGSPGLFIGKNGKDHFRGLIDDIKIYNRALAKEEIRRDYESGVKTRIRPAELHPLISPEILRGDGVALGVGRGGGMQVTVGKTTYSLTSAFSCPGESIGWNRLRDNGVGGNVLWKPTIRKISGRQIELWAGGEHYDLHRTIILDGGRLKVEDTLVNQGRAPVGIIAENRIASSALLKEVLLGGGEVSSLSMTAENPSIFLSCEDSSVGVLAEDNLFRLQFEATSNLLDQATFSIKHCALEAGKSYTLRWTLYLIPHRTDYFDFINLVRRDWKANVTVQGPFDWISIRDPDDDSHSTGSAPLGNPDRLKAYLERRKLRIVGLLPYLSYFSGAPLTPEQYNTKMRRAMRALKAVDPGIKCLGCIENNIISYDRAKMKQGRLFDQICRETGEYPLPLSLQQTKVLEQDLPWRDSFVRNRNGQAMIEDCRPRSFVHAMVYSAPGNYHTRYLLDQAKFLMEEVGMDGLYMDHFNMAFENTQRYDYSRWDGTTVDIDPKTGQIGSRYTDAALVGIGPRKELCDYIFSKGGTFVVNTHNVANETQAMPVMHFEEVGSNADPRSLKPGEEPPLVGYIAKLQLDSPLGLGIPSSNKSRPDLQDAEEVMKTVIVYLRHGLLYYHNQTVIPETGPGSGEYGPINHMFPLTPVELHKGWIMGRERIVSAVSIDTLWQKSERPRACVFDINGREVQASDRCVIRRHNGKWRVSLKLRDWQEIAVVE